MTASVTLPQVSSLGRSRPAAAQRPSVLLIGNPNIGKTTLFNALTGLRAKTSNYPGTTVEHRTGTILCGPQRITLIDLPGIYDLNSGDDEQRVARQMLLCEAASEHPRVIVLLMDATAVHRNLFLASQVLELGLPTVVALNMMDLAHKRQLHIDIEALRQELGCPVVATVARQGRGMDELRDTIAQSLSCEASPLCEKKAAKWCSHCSGCPFRGRFEWAQQIDRRVVRSHREVEHARSDAIDRVLTHPWIGAAAFMGVVFVVFAMIFWMAEYPMHGIDWLFGVAGAALSAWLPAGEINNLMVDGIIGGVGGVLVFLPQICLLFFFLTLLEDSGYMARAAFVMDRWMRRVGLPGKAFVPLLSAHACAIPAIMAARAIDHRRDRLATILILPLMSCSARIPVYAMLVALLFPTQPLIAAGVFTGAYALGITMAMAMAWLFKRSLLKGETGPLVLELPTYKWPTLGNALLTMWDRTAVFVKRAGTLILVASMVLWVLSNYPRSEMPSEALAMHQQADVLMVQGETEAAEAMVVQADRLAAQSRLAGSVAAGIGRTLEPVLQPLGYDWRIGMGILSSFAAREMIVSTMAITYGLSADAAESEDSRGLLLSTLSQAKRDDGTPVFTTATAASLLVFYVLAMQCLPTQIVTRRETGSWKWAGVQLLYMTVLAYSAAWLTFEVVSRVSGA